MLNNHRAKVFLPGIADPDTLEYASRLIGDEEITMPSVTRDLTGGRSTTSSRGPRRLLPPEDLRCLRRGEAVLVYGTLPPAASACGHGGRRYPPASAFGHLADGADSRAALGDSTHAVRSMPKALRAAGPRRAGALRRPSSGRPTRRTSVSTSA